MKEVLKWKLNNLLVIIVRLPDNAINRVTPTKDYPVNHGWCCIKGLNLDKQNTVFPNLVLPLMRNAKGEMEQISWENAFKEFATKRKGIQHSLK